MADAKAVKPTIIIKKKKGGGGHGAHGGAWKVAYADFVTAMMCFFLVMWLMGADEATKEKIADFFIHSPWDSGRDPASEQIHPEGRMQGVGDSLLKGLDGRHPDELVPHPMSPVRNVRHNEEVAQRAIEVLDEELFGLDVSIEFLKFSVPADLFYEEKSAELKPEAIKYLDRLGKLFKSYNGYLTIVNHIEDKAAMPNNYSNAYEFSLSRSVSVMNYMMGQNWMDEEHIMPMGNGAKTPFARVRQSEDQARNRRVEFILSETQRF